MLLFSATFSSNLLSATSLAWTLKFSWSCLWVSLELELESALSIGRRIFLRLIYLETTSLSGTWWRFFRLLGLGLTGLSFRRDSFILTGVDVRISVSLLLLDFCLGIERLALGTERYNFWRSNHCPICRGFTRMFNAGIRSIRDRSISVINSVA